jgi:hypothetical protein
MAQSQVNPWDKFARFFAPYPFTDVDKCQIGTRILFVRA